MKYIVLLMLSFNVNAQCFTDFNGFQTCIDVKNNIGDYRTDANSPKLYENGIYRGNLNNNIFDPNSINNQFGVYGNPLSAESIKNPYRIQNVR